MSTGHPQNLQLPLCPRTLLITDVTKLQPFTVGGDSFRENIETLISYNVRNDRVQQDCLYIEQGHLMTPTTFMTYSMAIDPRKTVVVTWTPIRIYSTQQHLYRDHLHILPFKGLPLPGTCHIPQNQREGGNDHTRL